MERAGVPDAPINKNRQPDFPEYEIRFSEYCLMPPPTRDAMGAEYPDQSKFGRFVATPTDEGHNLRTLGWSEHVRCLSFHRSLI